MNRLIVALLAALDALVAAAVGIAAALAPLTVLWVVGFAAAPDWGGLWPTAARIWQLGHFVPLHITLPPEYLVATGIAPEAASFTLSLAPLAFAAFTAWAGARSGARAARAGTGLTGVASAAVVMAAIAVLVRLTSGNPVATIYTWQAVLLPTLVFAVPALCAALVGAWRRGDDGLVDAARERMTDVVIVAVGATTRALGIAIAGLVAVGALVVAAGFLARGGQIFALFQGAGADAVGATMLTLGQLAYLPTLVVWGAAFAAGPGVAMGAGTSVSPAGTNVGIVPGIPVLGVLPESTTPWLLALVLAIVAVGFLAGWAARDRLLATSMAVRATAAGALALSGAGVAALLAATASGSIGPGALAHIGPAPGPVALAVGLELAVGAAIALLTPARGVVGAFTGGVAGGAVADADGSPERFDAPDAPRVVDWFDAPDVPDAPDAPDRSTAPEQTPAPNPWDDTAPLPRED